MNTSKVILLVLFLLQLSSIIKSEDSDKKQGWFSSEAETLKEAMVESTENVKEAAVESSKNIREAIEDIDKTLTEIATNSLPKIEETSSNFGRNFGLGTITYIGSGIGKTHMAITTSSKTAAAAVSGAATKGLAWVMTVPATPYILGAGAVGVATYGGYRLYRRCVPTEEEKRLYSLRKRTLLAEKETKLVDAQTELSQKREKLAQAEVKELDASLLLLAKRCEHQKKLLSMKD